MTTALDLTDIDLTVTDGPDQLRILDGIDLRVAAGELVAVTGESGSGKSTLIAVAGLLRRPDRGRVVINGEDLTEASDRRRTAARLRDIGLIFQSANLLPSLTAIEQLELVAHLSGRITAADRSRAAELLDAVGLDHRRLHRPAQLSGGERQRVAVARALMSEPSVVLADEPTASLDDSRGREVMALLAELTHRRRVAAVVVTHAPHQLAGDPRTLRLRAGRLDPDQVSGPSPLPEVVAAHRQ